jgi:hypothetical protein
MACGARSEDAESAARPDHPAGEPASASPSEGVASPAVTPPSGSRGVEPSLEQGNANDELCGPLRIAPEQPDPVSITVRNERSSAIVVLGPVGCERTSVTVVPIDPNTPGSWQGQRCVDPCHEAIQGLDSCGLGCSTPPAVLVRPSETGTIEWTGQLIYDVPLPEECCTEPPSCLQECQMVVPAGPGKYRGTIGFAELSEAEAELCGKDPSECPFPGDGSTMIETSEHDFELGAGAVEFTVVPARE